MKLGGKCEVCGSDLEIDWDRTVRSDAAKTIVLPCSECQVRGDLQKRGVPAEYQRCRLENFRVETEQDEKALRTAHAFIERGGERWLVISGDIGRGKTHLATGVFRGMLRFNSRWIDQPEAITELRVRGERWESGSFTAKLQDAKLLLWDDYGVGIGAKDEGALIESVFHRRTANRLTTIVTTNLSGKAFGASLGPRLAERIREKIFAWVSLSGESRRVRQPIIGDESR